MKLQEKLEQRELSGVPLPMVGMEENLQAFALRKAGLTYGAIARAMRLYHGSTRSENGWRRQLRSQGAAPRHHPSGAPRLAPQQREDAS